MTDVRRKNNVCSGYRDLEAGDSSSRIRVEDTATQQQRRQRVRRRAERLLAAVSLLPNLVVNELHYLLQH